MSFDLDDLDARLRRDARTVASAPSPAARARLRARMAALPAPRPPRRWHRLAMAAMAAAVLLLALLPCAHLLRPPAAPPAAPLLPAAELAPRAVARALEPLRAELAGLRQDGVALAQELWRQVPQPVRALLR